MRIFGQAGPGMALGAGRLAKSTLRERKRVIPTNPIGTIHKISEMSELDVREWGSIVGRKDNNSYTFSAA